MLRQGVACSGAGSQHIDGVARAGSALVAQAPRAGRVRAPGSPDHVGARLASRTVQGSATEHGDEANSIIADGGDLGTCRPQVTS